MVGPSADLTTEWEGGSLGELVALLQSSALPVRIEVIAPGTTSNAGEVHLLAGGLADAFAGSLRRDDAMAALQRLEGARFVVEARLPDPESGSLATPGPREGSLKDRPVAALMRYCEDYVLTCRLEVWRGPERAAISYRRGEIISTMVGGADGSERLPEVMGWTDGSYEIVLPAPVLPQTSARKGSVRASDPMGKVERKRHTTLPMTAGSAEAEAISSGSASAGAATARSASSPPPARPTPPAPSAPSQPAKPAPPVPAAQAKPASSSPANTTARLSPPVQPAPAPTAKPAAPAPTSASVQPPGTRPQTGQPAQGRQTQPAPPSAPASPAEQAARPAGAPATTVRGPAGAAAPGPSAAKPAPTAPQQAAAPVAQTRPASRAASPTAQADGPAAQVTPAQAPGAKAQGRAATPAMGTRAVRSTEPLAPEMTARGTPPVPAVPLIPPRATHPTPPPIVPAKAVAAGTDQKAGKTEGSTPPVVPVPPAPAPFQLAQPASARPGKQAPASNDLKPASGTIEAKTRHSNHLPPVAAPIEIADQPSPEPAAEPQQPVNQVMIPSRPTTSRRARGARKGLGEQSVKVYILIGLAIGAGVVVAYWAYWYLPFFHH